MDIFKLKKFNIRQDRAAMKVGTDSMLLGAWTKAPTSGQALDIGTGTGILSLILAQRFPDLLIDAIEPDPGSVLDASENFMQMPWSERLTLHSTTLQDFYIDKLKGKYDLIISNPPFFEPSPLNKIGPLSKARQTINLPHEHLIHLCFQLLSRNGSLSLILPKPEAETFRAFAERQSFFCRRLCQVRSLEQKPVRRYLMEFQKIPGYLEKTELIIMNGNSPNDYNEAYKELLKNFYPFL